MNTKELKTEWEKEINTYDGKPVILKKDDVRTIITDAIDGASAYWCDYCGIEKPVKIVPSSDIEPEAETLANGGTLAFYVTEPSYNMFGRGRLEDLSLLDLSSLQHEHAFGIMVIGAIEDIPLNHV